MSKKDMWTMLVTFFPDVEISLLERFRHYLTTTHFFIVLEKVKEPEKILFYLEEACLHRWNCDELKHQIDSKLYARAGGILMNFEGKLPPDLTNIARRYFNAPADFHLKTLAPFDNELAFTEALAKDAPAFLTGLGRGFSYKQKQFRLKNYIPDFLLYHTELNCHVIAEMKMTKFKAEFIGKMNSYLEETDLLLGNDRQRPSIGLIYCTDMDNDQVMSALKNSNKPIGVATYLIDGRSPRAARRQ
jgi:predicted nuclease of restriction endonuclease-like (RecB) superfamily